MIDWNYHIHNRLNWVIIWLFVIAVELGLLVWRNW